MDQIKKSNKLKVVKSSRSAGIKRVPLCSGVFELVRLLFKNNSINHGLVL